MNLIPDNELIESLSEAGLPNAAYQQHQRDKHDRAIESGNATAARDAVWRAASDQNLIDEAREPELTADRAATLKTQLGWK